MGEAIDTACRKYASGAASIHENCRCREALSNDNDFADKTEIERNKSYVKKKEKKKNCKISGSTSRFCVWHLSALWLTRYKIALSVSCIRHQLKIKAKKEGLRQNVIL